MPLRKKLMSLFVKVGALISLRLTRFLSILAYAGRWKRYYKVAKLRGWHPFGRAKPASNGYHSAMLGLHPDRLGLLPDGLGLHPDRLGLHPDGLGLHPDGLGLYLDGLGYRAPQNSL